MKSQIHFTTTGLGRPSQYSQAYEIGYHRCSLRARKQEDIGCSLLCYWSMPRQEFNCHHVWSFLAANERWFQLDTAKHCKFSVQVPFSNDNEMNLSDRLTALHMFSCMLDYSNVSITHRTVTWTSGSLTCFYYDLLIWFSKLILPSSGQDKNR